MPARMVNASATKNLLMTPPFGIEAPNARSNGHFDYFWRSPFEHDLIRLDLNTTWRRAQTEEVAAGMFTPHPASQSRNNNNLDAKSEPSLRSRVKDCAQGSKSVGDRGATREPRSCFGRAFALQVFF